MRSERRIAAIAVGVFDARDANAVIATDRTLVASAGVFASVAAYVAGFGTGPGIGVAASTRTTLAVIPTFDAAVNLEITAVRVQEATGIFLFARPA